MFFYQDKFRIKVRYEVLVITKEKKVRNLLVQIFNKDLNKSPTRVHFSIDF